MRNQLLRDRQSRQVLHARWQANPGVLALLIDRTHGSRKGGIGERTNRYGNRVFVAFYLVVNGRAATGAEVKPYLAAAVTDSHIGC